MLQILRPLPSSAPGSSYLLTSSSRVPTCSECPISDLPNSGPSQAWPLWCKAGTRKALKGVSVCLLREKNPEILSDWNFFPPHSAFMGTNQYVNILRSGFIQKSNGLFGRWLCHCTMSRRQSTEVWSTRKILKFPSDSSKKNTLFPIHCSFLIIKVICGHFRCCGK